MLQHLLAMFLLFVPLSGFLCSRACAGGFITATTYAAGSYPNSVAVGDFNADGQLDLAVGNNADPGTVSILLNSGGGAFQAAQNYAVGSHPEYVAVGDFNGDGHLDLATASAETYPHASTVSILLGNGDGTFQPAVSYLVGSHPQSIAVADFNGDGYLDLAVANYFSGTVSILTGNGDGTFRTAQHCTAGGDPTSVAVGDFNGDGIPDLAVAVSYSAVTILLGKGDGSFGAARSYAAGSSPASVTVGDFNGDGIADLIVANATELAMDSVTVLFGKGDGTFRTGQSFPTGAGAFSVAVGDFNGDANLDLAVADSSGVSILLGNGDGTFQVPQIYGVGSSYAVVAGHLNGDGYVDLAVANYNSDTVSILLGKGDGTFRAQASYPAGLSPVALAAGNFRGSSALDLAVANSGDYEGGISIPSNLSVLLGKGNGTFQSAVNYSDSSYPQSVAVGDFNGDGLPDLAVAGGFGLTVRVGNGDGTFQEPLLIDDTGFHVAVAVGDFNGDGRLDLVVAGSDTSHREGAVMIWLGNGDGTFQAPHCYTAGDRPASVAVADFDGDGRLDLAVASQGTYPHFDGTVSIFMGNGDGSFRAPQSYATGTGSGRPCVAIGDFDSDGIPDVAVVNSGTSPDYQGTLFILLGKGDGTFQASQSCAAGFYATCVAVADFNRDGKLDLIVDDLSGVTIMLGNGDGTFRAAHSYAAGGFPVSVVVEDFNGDGYPDLAVADYWSNTVSVLLNAADWGG